MLLSKLWRNLNVAVSVTFIANWQKPFPLKFWLHVINFYLFRCRGCSSSQQVCQCIIFFIISLFLLKPLWGASVSVWALWHFALCNFAVVMTCPWVEIQFWAQTHFPSHPRNAQQGNTSTDTSTYPHYYVNTHTCSVIVTLCLSHPS